MGRTVYFYFSVPAWYRFVFKVYIELESGSHEKTCLMNQNYY